MSKHYSRAERERALKGLKAFVESPEHAETTALGVLGFWEGLQDLSESEVDRVSSDEAEFRCLLWILFDFAPDHETMVSRYLARAVLSLGERTWLERMARSRVRLYEVREVRKDQGLTLKDLWNDQVVEVRERLATRQLMPWDLVAVRVIEGEHGHPVLEGTPWLFAPLHAPALLHELRLLHRRLKKRKAGADEDALFREAALLFQDFWFDEATADSTPELATTDGDEMSLVRVTFVVHDEERVRTLLREAAFEEDPQGTMVWLDKGGHRVLGELLFQPGRCVLEALSEPRARKGRKLLEKLLGGLVSHRSTVVEDALQAADRAVRSESAMEIPPADFEAAATEFLGNYYRSWLDESIPALGGRTPRHAAQLKSMRPALVALLKQVEAGAAAQQSAGQPHPDLSFLWTELGITRD